MRDRDTYVHVVLGKGSPDLSCMRAPTAGDVGGTAGGIMDTAGGSEYL